MWIMYLATLDVLLRIYIRFFCHPKFDLRVRRVGGSLRIFLPVVIRILKAILLKCSYFCYIIFSQKKQTF